MSKRILIVDDERPIRVMLRIGLEAAGYEVVEAENMAQALAGLVYPVPDLVLLDLVLPDGSGAEIVSRVREFSKVPVIVLSALGADADKIALLDAGADDYITKPFNMGELLARVRAALRHSQESMPGPLEAGGVRIDPAIHSVTVHDEEVHLTPTEYAILLLLLENRDRVLTREQLIRRVWGTDANETGSLRVHIFQLRQKLKRASCTIETLPGVGYRLHAP